jgi:PAS domain S-box-containing protein
MLEFLRNLLHSDFMAHGFCYRWRPEIVWLHVGSDALIALAYYSIPVTLVYFVRKRRDLPFHWIFLMFGAFILGCGATHAAEVWTVWHGTYRLAGVIKLVTAALSIGTAIGLVRIVPDAMALPSPARLAAVNRELEQEARVRLRRETEIEELNAGLERRVRERTAELELANRELQNEIHQRERAEERFRLAVESSPNPIVMVNQSARIVLVNAEAERLFGYGRAELLGQRIEILIPESLRDDHEGMRSAFLANPQARVMGSGGELRAQRKDGSQFPVEIALNPVETAEGTWVLSSIVDMTFQRQKMESVGVLASGIAHDFNNLLGSILADAELAQADLEDGLSPMDQLRSIQAVSIRAAEIVRELMIYAGQEEAHREPVDVLGLVEEMLALLKVSISKDAVLKTDLANGLPPVAGNAPQLRQVVMNLILNASEALGGRGGTICISTSLVMRNGESGADHLKLEVSDTGVGISDEEKAKIFDPFFTTKFAGRGLGLAVVQGIVRGHRGSIQVISAPREGTTFQILLPCESAAASANGTGIGQAALPEVARVEGTVLVVEDQDSLRMPVAKALAKQGFGVIEAANGPSAIERLRSQDKIDMVLLDMTIPGCSSREVIVEAARARPEIKLVLTSAYSREMLADYMGTPLVLGFLRKPFSLDELVRLLRGGLSKAAAR